MFCPLFFLPAVHERLDVEAQCGHNLVNVVAVELAQNGRLACIVKAAAGGRRERRHEPGANR